LKLDPRCADAYGVLGLAHRGLGENDQAIRKYQRALAINPAQPEFLGSLAEIYFSRGQYRQALEEVKKVAQSQPDRPDLLILAGSIYAMVGQMELAREQAAALHRLNPEFAKKLEDLVNEAPRISAGENGGEIAAEPVEETKLAGSKQS
jgi:tetratricopeptide (TPR) repeat protein